MKASNNFIAESVYKKQFAQTIFIKIQKKMKI